MQTLVIEGYLAADPSILSAQGSGRKRASFRVLETTRYRRADGEQGERTTGFNCVCFNEATAEKYIEPFARKGSRVVIQGHVENDTWTGKDGVEHYDLRLIVADIRLKNRRDRAGNDDAASEDVTGSGTGFGIADGYDLNDDIPF
ncbi:MAG: single-stranded DNA-binding protein [Brevundimonas sp.]|jgi:single-stranded DNA-binding protein|uniref:single-stranded DNA-binding protein n=1 Tax=Brevundimonas sp. TaxID=1871086 RepID=UPI0025BD7F6B|nr:single-stranded DNA-binding protein [Brevundimonas sp.]MCH4269670.1 single-stranded DNA-binding protein [Brevundimonas sp.]